MDSSSVNGTNGGTPHGLVLSRDPDADRLNAQWCVLKSTARTMLDQAIIFGDMLIEKHKLIAAERHGDWIPWVRANCEFGYESAAGYMKLARNKDKFSTLNFSTMRRALAFLDEEKHKDDPGANAEKKKAKPHRSKTDPALAFDELPKEQRQLVTRLVNIKIDDKVREMVDRVTAMDKREKALDKREAELTAREKALAKREAALDARGGRPASK